MTDQEARAEALRRIEEARRTKAAVLDLGQLRQLRILALGHSAVTVREDQIAWKWEDARSNQPFSDLSPLEGLTALQSLDLTGCQNVSDLSALGGLTALRSLNLNLCFD